MKKIKHYWPMLIPVLVIAFVIYYFANALNPDSRFCFYKIYKQPNGTFEVWWVGRSSRLERTCSTLKEAKEVQARECSELKSFMLNRPKGKRVP